MTRLRESASQIISPCYIPTNTSLASLLVALLGLLSIKCCLHLKGVYDAIATFSTDLDVMYDRLMARICHQMPEEAELGRIAVFWAAHSLRPFRMDELQDSMANMYDAGTYVIGEYDTDAVTPSEVVHLSTGGLIRVDEWTILTHMLREYLLPSPQCQPIHTHFLDDTAYEAYRKFASYPPFSQANELLTMHSITHLVTYQDGKLDDYHPKTPKEQETFRTSFLSYCDRYWGVYARTSAASDPKIRAPIVEYLKKRGTKRVPYENNTAPKWYGEETDLYGPVLLVAFFDLVDILPLVKELHEPSAQGLTALHVAVKYNNEAIAKALLSSAPGSIPHFDLNAQTENGHTALHFAAATGLEWAVRLLLAQPTVDTGLKAKSGETAAELARSQGYGEIAEQISSKA